MRQFPPRVIYYGLAARPLFDVLSRFERATQQRVHAIGKRNKNSHFFLLNCARGGGGARSASSQQYRVPPLTVTGVPFSWSVGRALWGTQPNAFANVADALRGGHRKKAARRTPTREKRRNAATRRFLAEDARTFRAALAYFFRLTLVSV